MHPAAYEQMMKSFGRKLRNARLREGYTSAEAFATMLDINPPTYRTYERGEAEPGFANLLRICSALKITPNDLLPVPRQAEQTQKTA